jgi:hypothetical protein
VAKVDIGKLKGFLVEAKKNTYAGGGNEVVSQRLGFRELEYRKGDFYYRDCYVGYFQAPGMEAVYFKGKPVWTMAYAGKMHENHYDKAEKAYTFLKKSLLKVPVDYPYRGPKSFKEGDFTYEFEFKGSIKQFRGREKIYLDGEEIFYQDVVGGLVIDK